MISNLFREIDSIDYMDELTPTQKTERKVQLLEPYIQSIGVALPQWLLYDMLGLMDIPLLGQTDLFAALDTLSLLAVVGELGLLIGSLLPTFASYDADAPNPSLNLYIDLDPQSSAYGHDDAKEIAPGIQAIELMVNAETSPYYSSNGRALAGINDSGGKEENATLYYDGSQGTLHEAYVLSINPRNLTTAANDTTYSGE